MIQIRLALGEDRYIEGKGHLSLMEVERRGDALRMPKRVQINYGLQL